VSISKHISKEEFDAIYRQYGPMVLRRCRYLLKDEEKAKDAMQDVFVRILENQYKITKLCSSLFFTTATRVCLNRIRADKYRSGPDFEVIAETIMDNASSRQEELIDVSLLLNCIFNDADPRDREILTLHYVDGLTLEDTAKQVKMSVPGIRKRISAFKQNAKHHYGDNK